MHTLGHGFVPAGIHAGGLRYHGMSPLISHLLELGLMEAQAVKQTTAFEAAVLFARTEGILPAPEPTHAIRLAVDEALAARESGEEKTILFGLSGHGHFDLAAGVAEHDLHGAGALRAGKTGRRLDGAELLEVIGVVVGLQHPPLAQIHLAEPSVGPAERPRIDLREALDRLPAALARRAHGGDQLVGAPARLGSDHRGRLGGTGRSRGHRGKRAKVRRERGR